MTPSRARDRTSGGKPDGMINERSARIFWSDHPVSGRVADVWVSTTDQSLEAFTEEYFSARWNNVVGNCDVAWLEDPAYTPEAVFGEMIETGFHDRTNLVGALRQFAKIDSCDWAQRMLGRLVSS